MGSFFGNLLGAYGNTMLQKEDMERKRQDADRRARLQIYTDAASNPNFNWSNPDAVKALSEGIDETVGVKGGKGTKKEGKTSLHDVLSKLGSRMQGKVPQPAGLQKPVNLQGMMMTPEQQAQQQADKQIAVANSKRLAVKKALTESGLYDQLSPEQKIELETAPFGVKVGNTKGTVIKVPNKNSSTGWSYASLDPSTGQQVGGFGPEAPPPSSAKPRQVQVKNGIVTDDQGRSYSVDDPKLPEELKPIVESAKKYQKEAYSIAAELHKEHPDWTPEQIQAATQRPSFPRIAPVNDAQGNTLGWNYFQGTAGGGVSVKFVGAEQGGAPLEESGGVIPPKPTSTSLTMAQMATTVTPEIQRVSKEVDTTAAALGPLTGRWNEVMVGKVGVDNPAVAGLQQDLFLLASAVVRTHFGAKGGQEYIQALENYFRLSQSPDDLKARIASSEEWIDRYAGMAGNKPKRSMKDPLGVLK